MQRLAVTPWRNFGELLQVKQDIYIRPRSAEVSRDHDALQKQRQAVYLISAWAMRGRIPHAVQSTGLLMEALFNHQNPHSSSFNIQAVYAAAFARFVTGFCDMSMANKVRQNMHQAAANIGMPAEWVDIRHEIAHGNQPRTPALEGATKEALAWLWTNFWAKLDLGEENGSLSQLRDTSSRLKRPQEEILSLRKSQDELHNAGFEQEQSHLKPSISLDDLPEFLLKFVRLRINEISIGAQVKSEDSATSNAAYEIINLCLDIPERLHRLSEGLVQPKLMIPEERNQGDSMEGAFMIWKPLINTLRKYQSNFMEHLMARMVTVLAEPESINPWPYALREAVYEWIIRLITPSRPSVAKSRREAYVQDTDMNHSRNTVAKQCTLSPPNFWIDKLLLSMTQQGPEDFKRRWQRYAKKR